MFWGKLWRRGASPFNDSPDGRLLGLRPSSIAFIDDISSKIISTRFFESFETGKSFKTGRLVDKWRQSIRFLRTHQEVEIFYHRHNNQSAFWTHKINISWWPHFHPKSECLRKLCERNQLRCQHLNWFMLSAVPWRCLNRDNTDLGVKTVCFVCVHWI